MPFYFTRHIIAKFLIMRIFISVALVGVSFLAVFKASNKSLSNLKIGILITLSLIINNFSWQHHFVWLIFPFFATFFFIRDKRPETKYFAILFLAYLLVAFNLKYPQEVPVFFQSHVFFGALLLWVLDVFLVLNNTIDTKS